MNTPEYHSAIYKLNSNKQIATRVCISEYNCNLLPKEMDFQILAKILCKMQNICFNDRNVKNRTLS